jgi:hypothetical protein
MSWSGQCGSFVPYFKITASKWPVTSSSGRSSRDEPSVLSFHSGVKRTLNRRASVL